MKSLDIIIPNSYLNLFKKDTFLPESYRWNWYWFPIWLFKKELKRLGLKIRFRNINYLNNKSDSQIVLMLNRVDDEL